MHRDVRGDLFPPGEYLRDELEARGWTQEDLAAILGRPLKTVNQILSAKKAITPQTAQELAAAFGTSAEVWLNLENAYRLGLEKREGGDIKRRARLYDMAPIKDMRRRHWIKEAETLGELEDEVRRFFEIGNLEDEPCLVAAARKSATYQQTTASQKAWLFRAKDLASALRVAPYEERRLEEGLRLLHALTTSEQEVRRVPGVLADMGIRFVVVEHLPRTRIDGAALWLDQASPVVALSLRYDRIDGFWFTLAHELSHIRHRDLLALDNDLVGAERAASADKPEAERRADEEASQFLIPTAVLDNFIARVRPFFSKNRIIQFANLHGIHPGIVVGQLQNRKVIGYSHSREMLVSVRGLVAAAALTDGWGNLPGV